MEMKNKASKKELITKILKQEIDTQTEEELLDVLVKSPISVDIEKREDSEITFGDKLADKVAELVGSWPFIIVFSVFLIGWMIINGVLLMNKSYDPYPFILLNLVLSCIAALQAPIIMMSQNRQAKKDSLRNQNDYQIDLKSEILLEDLYENIKELSKNQKQILKELEELKKK